MDFGTICCQLKFHTRWVQPHSGGTSANSKRVPRRSMQDTPQRTSKPFGRRYGLIFLEELSKMNWLLCTEQWSIIELISVFLCNVNEIWKAFLPLSKISVVETLMTLNPLQWMGENEFTYAMIYNWLTRGTLVLLCMKIRPAGAFNCMPIQAKIVIKRVLRNQLASN